jgi:FAD/FMN-containing dehydrogenase
MSADGELLAALRAVVGNRYVLTEPDVVAGQVVDWTGRFRGTTPAVVRPGSYEEVAAVLRACSDSGTSVVPQGGNTGLVGGSVPLRNELVLDLRRLDTLSEIDARAAQVTAGAGVTLARLQSHVRAAGWEFGVDLAARDSATVGGMVATNAGGVHVLRYGAMRAQVVGVEAVLADGRVLRHLDGLEKDNTGYDLAGLLCGSEGTLAVVTAARLRLVGLLAHTVVALVGFDDVDIAMNSVGTLRQTVDSLHALEVFFGNGLDLVCRRLGLAPPFARDCAVYVLVEVAANHDPTDELAAAVGALVGVADVAVATDAAAARALWRYREAHAEAIAMVGTPHKLDVTVPIDRLAEFAAAVPVVVDGVARGAAVWLFGHAGDGNMHVNVTGVDATDDAVDDAVFHLVAQLHGSISAEHGIGTAKARWLGLVRSDAEIDTFRSIKRALDPAGILNPNVLVSGRPTI